MEDTIAQTDIHCVPPAGAAFTSTLRVARPLPNVRGMWSCSLSMVGFFDEARPLHGDDSLQALCLALAHAHGQLEAFVSGGGRLFIPGSTDEFPLNAYFRAPNI